MKSFTIVDFLTKDFCDGQVLNYFFWSGDEEPGGNNILVASLVAGTVAERYKDSCEK